MRASASQCSSYDPHQPCHYTDCWVAHARHHCGHLELNRWVVQDVIETQLPTMCPPLHRGFLTASLSPCVQGPLHLVKASAWMRSCTRMESGLPPEGTISKLHCPAEELSTCAAVVVVRQLSSLVWFDEYKLCSNVLQQSRRRVFLADFARIKAGSQNRSVIS